VHPVVGPLERNTIEPWTRSSCPGYLFYTHGARGADERLFGPDADPKSLELFSHYFADWVTEYNTVGVHSELAGQTPLGRWRRTRPRCARCPPSSCGGC